MNKKRKTKKPIHPIAAAIVAFLVCMGGGITGAELWTSWAHPKHHLAPDCFQMIDGGVHMTYCEKHRAAPQSTDGATNVP
jgi:hypothetical protein